MALGPLRRFHRKVAGTSVGHTLRNIIHLFVETVHPYIKLFIPNFRTAHYVYIIFMSFLGSVIVYAISNFRYIDILFLMSGSCTQAGLNTINLNELRLLQQILVYLFTTLTTPIFIHLSLLFVRLYWFERHFDDIKESSMLNFKMRRSATLAARTNSLDPTTVNTVTNQGLGFSRHPSLIPSSRAEHTISRSQQKERMVISEENGSHTESSESAQKGSSLPAHEDDDHRNMYSEPSDDEEQPRVAPDQVVLGNLPDRIKFGDLPHPSKKRKDIDPSDMYKSITMLQKNRRDSGLEEDVLVIKSPKEIEKDRNMPIFTKKSPFHSTSRRNMKWRVKNLRRKHGWDHVRRPIKRRISLNSFNENESIDSEAEEVDDEDDEEADEDEHEHMKQKRNIDDLLDTDNEGHRDDYSVFSDESENDADHDGQKSDIVDPKDTSYRPKFVRSFTSDRPSTARRLSRKLSRWRTPTISRFRTGTDEYLEGETDDEGHSLRNVNSANYLSWVPTIGRNSTFIHLTEEQKEELGGVEYRAVKLLIKILIVFYVGFHIVAFLLLVIYINFSKNYAAKMRAVGVSPTWWGFFTAQSSFNDLGFTLTPNSMMTYNKSAYVLIVSSFFIIIGNTGFPIMLRFIVWVMFKISKPLSLIEESLGFLLDHPRRCFTMLFPSLPTWWLLFILVILNAIDLILFIILDFGGNYLLDIPKGFRALDGLYQAFSTRTAGFAVVDLSQLAPAVQVSYMIMMYISVLPMAISIRRTNVYEEQSLGIYAADADEQSDGKTKNFIGSHLRNQLSFDLWFIFLGLFIICIAEGGKLKSNDLRFNIFSVLFEIISAYCTVGLSLGYPNVDQSLSHEFTTVSKLVIIAMMIRGRHRGLPYSLDRAIMLPDDDMQKRDKLQENHAAQRAAQRIETAPTLATFTDPHASASERFNGLKKTITRKAAAYRKNSMFPAPTKLPPELHEMRTYPLL